MARNPGRRARGADAEAAPPARAASRPRGAAPATPLEAARAIALRVLAFHARSEAQLRARLARAGHAGEAEEVVAWARRLGYLDDAAYARARARALLAPGRGGPRAAERRLRAEGLPDALAAAAIAAALEERAGEVPGRRAGEGDEAALCRAALAKRLRGADPGALDARARARHARFLLARGFAGDVVARALGLDA